MSSLWPLILLTSVVCYLSSQGTALQTSWLVLSIFDLSKALRHSRPNGRRIGVLTRKKSMREALMSCIIFVILSSSASALDIALGWMPLFAPLKMAVTIAFIHSRLPISAHLYITTLRPLLRRYETPIDLTFLLISSVATLAIHYMLVMPLELAGTVIRSPFRWLQSCIRAQAEERRGSVKPIARLDEATVDEDAMLEPMSPLAAPGGISRQRRGRISPSPLRTSRSPSSTSSPLSSPDGNSDPSKEGRSIPEGISAVVDASPPQIEAGPSAKSVLTTSPDPVESKIRAPLDASRRVAPSIRSANIPRPTPPATDLALKGLKGFPSQRIRKTPSINLLHPPRPKATLPRSASIAPSSTVTLIPTTTSARTDSGLSRPISQRQTFRDLSSRVTSLNKRVAIDPDTRVRMTARPPRSTTTTDLRRASIKRPKLDVLVDT